MPVLRDLKSWQSCDPGPYRQYLVIERGGRKGFGVLPGVHTLFAVGWLGSEVSSIGRIPEPCIDRLVEAYERGLIFLDEDLAQWRCLVCPERDGPDGVIDTIEWKGREVDIVAWGNHAILHADNIYVCPAFILHYILRHQYRPPNMFQRALTEGRFLSKDDLVFAKRQ